MAKGTESLSLLSEVEEQDKADDIEIKSILAKIASGGDLDLSFEAQIDQSSKHEDAIDYEDFSDNELPDIPEAEATSGNSLEVPALTDDGDTDDLFGEGREGLPFDDDIFGPPSPAAMPDPDVIIADASRSPNLRDLNFDPEPMQINQDPDIPEAAESKEDLLRAAWPTFTTGVVIKWSEMIPARKARWAGKRPVRKPRALTTAKLSLELAPDQEKLFRIPGAATSCYDERTAEIEARGLVPLIRPENDELAEEDNFDVGAEPDSERIGGFGLHDIRLACDDWAEIIDRCDAVLQREVECQLDPSRRDGRAKSQFPAAKRHLDDDDDDDDDDDVEEEEEEEAKKKEEVEKKEEVREEAGGEDDWDALFMEPVPREKLRPKIPSGLPEISRHHAPSSFDDFEEMTRRVAKRVNIDLGDPHLFLDTEGAERPAKRLRTAPRTKRMANGNMGRNILQRFNRSNDEAYEALKENHQSKVRATLGNIAVEHGMPAKRLTWPYYNVKFDRTAETYHRPRLQVGKLSGTQVRFSPLAVHKRKSMRGKASDVYRSTRDLTLGDNSTAVLFEYCERVPRVLSKFAMGNRIIHYYRRAGANDNPARPDIGESSVLLAEDRSPFSIFGTVAPGETVPAIHNEMYRAPIFKHAPRPTDFLCTRTSSFAGSHGSRWHLRKIDHLYVVGQTFPLVEVPGPHSRKITNVTKGRMKMLAYRLIKRDPNSRCQLSDITAHIAGSTDSQNRQKLKDFLSYEKRQVSEGKGLWKLRDGETVPDEAAIRGMIKPEDVCLTESMQLGVKELEDAGFDVRNVVLDDDGTPAAAGAEQEDDLDDDAKGGKKAEREETLANKMAPWKTTKAFLDACQGKAMLQLHGDGDPTGHGLGFSFIRTSMKGGYLESVQGPLATSADAIEREKRSNGGHAYNVRKQEAMYKDGIEEIWQKQKSSLSDPRVHDDEDVLCQRDEDERFDVPAATPAPAHFDEGMSQVSGLTASSRHAKKALEIVRRYRNDDGSERVQRVVVHDPVVISHYLKRKQELESENRDIFAIVPTGNENTDRFEQARILKELARLKKNKARREAREQQKRMQMRGSVSVGPAGSPESTGADALGAAGATTRKCANCGQVGHIKTNKKLCPILNGTMTASDDQSDFGGFGSFNAMMPVD